MEPQQVSPLFCIVVALNDTLASLKASVTQLIVFAAFSHPDASFQLKSYTCGSAALGASTALGTAKEVKLGFRSRTSFSVSRARPFRAPVSVAYRC